MGKKEDAIHEGGHGLTGVALGIPIRYITIKPDEEKGYAGHVVYDEEAIKARIVAMNGNAAEWKNFLLQLAMIGVAGEIADFRINGLTPQEAQSRSAFDLVPYHAYCDLCNVAANDRETMIHAARERMEEWFANEKTVQRIRAIAESLLEHETLYSDQLQQIFKN
jgi:hypothetical protein